ncbi:Rhomboid family intramembrane serine protease [Sulfidibacter corallicola]|uniref:Rhomboid family intramembrane serine protease n=1 Tax=Sulfidibacter corallicola TaxID=2818388 RepID=A0A8A4TN28_SULCO|nr:rhomboid family intramembrane serine protease [Sulfidibacter corallicola]QTD51376.1 rhomboid family intramembrane serine protease [Sulfidibacter corallicola]
MIPVSSENTRLRRKPVVTFVLLGAMLAGYLVTRLHHDTEDPIYPLAITAQYAKAFPDLETSEDFDRICAALPWLGHVRTHAPTLVKKHPNDQTYLAQLEIAAIRAWNDRTAQQWGLVPYAPRLPNFLTYAFIHTGLVALISTLLFLYILAPHVEDRWGRPFFAAFCTAAIASGGLVYLVERPQSLTPLIGAGPLVAALLGAYLTRFIKSQIRLAYVVPPFEVRYATIPIWAVAALWLILRWITASLAPTYRLTTGSPIAEITLFLTAAATAFLLKHLNVEKRLFSSEFDRLPGDLKYHARIGDALYMNDKETAYRLLTEAHRDHPQEFQFGEHLWNQAVRMDRAHRHGDLGVALVHRLTDECEYERAYFHWTELTQYVPDTHIDIDRALDLAQGLDQGNHRQDGERVLAHLLDAGPRLTKKQMSQWLEQAQFASPQLHHHGLLKELAESRWSDSEKTELDAQRLELERRFPELTDPKAEVLALALAAPPPIPTQEEAGGAAADSGFAVHEDPFTQNQVRKLRVMPVTPLNRRPRGLLIRRPGGQETTVTYGHVKGIAVAAIRCRNSKGFVVLDLLDAEPTQERAQHKALRMFGNQFKPTDLVPGHAKPAEAFRALIGEIHQKSGASLLPDPEILDGAPLPHFPSLEAFELQIYGRTSDQVGG